MIPRPPIATLPDTPFPYTPLFRAPHRADIAGGEVPLDEVDQPNVVRGVDPVLVLPHARDDRLGGSLGGDRPLLEVRVRPGERGGGLVDAGDVDGVGQRSEEHTSELQSLMRISYAGFWWKKK